MLIRFWKSAAGLNLLWENHKAAVIGNSNAIDRVSR